MRGSGKMGHGQERLTGPLVWLHMGLRKKYGWFWGRGLEALTSDKGREYKDGSIDVSERCQMLHDGLSSLGR